jgi:hypothetical protein
MAGDTGHRPELRLEYPGSDGELSKHSPISVLHCLGDSRVLGDGKGKLAPSVLDLL